MSQPVDGFLRLSWALESLGEDEFDPDKALSLLEDMDLINWSTIYRRVLREKDDPLDVVRCLMNLYIEVDVVVDVVAQGLNAAMEALTHPHTIHSAVVLSNAEYVRIACSVLVLRIYYQLCHKFIHAEHDHTSTFPELFIWSLQPWQIDQALTVERFFDTCHYDNFHGTSMFGIIDKEYTCKVCIAEKSSFFRFYQDFLDPWEKYGHNRTFPRALHEIVAQLDRRGRPRYWPPWQSDVNPWKTSPVASPTALRLNTSGWSFYNTILIETATDGRFRGNELRRGIPSLGLLFWDQDRLHNWGIEDHDDVSDLSDELLLRLQDASMDTRGKFSLQSPEEEQLSQARQVVEWTRQPVQCSLQEWLYQHTALARIKEGKRVIPSKYIEVGAVCYVCGLDGHRSQFCHEASWLRDEDDHAMSEQSWVEEYDEQMMWAV
ncbi:hypothetical protein ACN47E_007883 [Coniothyrium glycines]